MSRVFVLLQYLLPKHTLTAIVFRLARMRTVWVKNLFIERFVRFFDVDVDEIDGSVPDDFETFNAFFTRALTAGARPVDERADVLVSPVDGTLSHAGRLQDDSLVQAKGIEYTLDELLATELDNARAYDNGRYATIYLAPYNYHRVHAPFDGRLIAARHVPGDLFSVSAATVSQVPGLFRRNERLILHFDTTTGPAVVILVGALNVGSISTPWTGEIRPRAGGVVDVIQLDKHDREVVKGDLLGWFNMGSTVILLCPDGSYEWLDMLQPGRTLRMGEGIAMRTPGPS